MAFFIDGFCVVTPNVLYMILLAIWYGISAFALLHSYLLYPWLLRIIASRQAKFSHPVINQWPKVSIIMPVYNEAAVLSAKLDCLAALTYPAQQLAYYIGSDNSTDDTNRIAQKYADDNPNIHLLRFSQRRGKPSVVNDLVEQAIAHWGASSDHLLLLTDANVMLAPDTLQELVRYFVADAKVGLVDTHMRNTQSSMQDVSASEAQYIQREVLIKNREGRIWGTMMGPFGGCYAIRSTYWQPIPPKHLVDDFYVNMKVLEQGGKCCNNLLAWAYERTPGLLQHEWKRKARISAGNFQNLLAFRHLLTQPWRALDFCFWSHKVLRWLGPFFIIGMWLSSGLLAWERNPTFRFLFVCQTAVMVLIPILDLFFKKINIHWQPLRAANYFLWMNAALLSGFLKFVNGIRNNIWERTPRYTRH